jgi:hypothetical protein
MKQGKGVNESSRHDGWCAVQQGLLTEEGTNLTASQDLELASKAPEIMLEAIEAVQTSASNIPRLL